MAAENGHSEVFMWLLRNRDLDQSGRNFLHIPAAGDNCRLAEGFDGTGVLLSKAGF
jgi:hypothetical protein